MPNPSEPKFERLFVVESVRANRMEDALQQIQRLLADNPEVQRLVREALAPASEPILRASEFGPRLSALMLDAVQKSGALGAPENLPVQSVTLVASSLLARDQVLISNGREVREYRLVNLDTEDGHEDL